MLPKNIKSIDSFCLKPGKDYFFDYPLAKYVLKYKRASILHSKYGKTDHFMTGQFRFASKKRIPFDSLLRPIPNSPQKRLLNGDPRLYREIQERYFDIKNCFLDFMSGHIRGISPVKMWNLSIVSALIFGMFLMTFIYRYLGQSASARSGQMTAAALSVSQTEQINNIGPTYPGLVLGEEAEQMDISREEADNYVAEIIRQYQKESQNQDKMQYKIEEMVKGYPIEKMAPYISKQDPIVAAFLVGIAKKESNWGKHVPVLGGQDCFNYWGYRGIRTKMGSGGHTCFDSRQDAVETVAKRIRTLVYKENRTTPGTMVVWKCGYDCSWDSPKDVKKWISDVDMYFEEFDEFAG